jgi:predicted glycosyltransferase
VVIPRYFEQIKALRDFHNWNVIVPEKAVDGPSLLHFSDLFIGAGGTMSTEAAILGIPTISCYPGKPTLVELFLIERGLIERDTNLESIVKIASKFLIDPKSQKAVHQKRARLLVRNFEDPIKIITDEIEKRVKLIPI